MLRKPSSHHPLLCKWEYNQIGHCGGTDCEPDESLIKEGTCRYRIVTNNAVLRLTIGNYAAILLLLRRNIKSANVFPVKKNSHTRILLIKSTL